MLSGHPPVKLSSIKKPSLQSHIGCNFASILEAKDLKDRCSHDSQVVSRLCRPADPKVAVPMIYLQNWEFSRGRSLCSSKITGHSSHDSASLCCYGKTSPLGY